MSRADNNKTAGAVTLTTVGDDQAAFDQLPPWIRRAVGENVDKVNSVQVLAFLRSIERQVREFGGHSMEAEVWTMRKLLARESQEIDAFSEMYRAKYGRPTAHVGADATVQRYGSRDPKPPRRLRAGLLRRVPPAIRGMLVIQEAA